MLTIYVLKNLGCAMFAVNFNSAFDLSVNEYYYQVNTGACKASYVDNSALTVMQTTYPESLVQVIL